VRWWVNLNGKPVLKTAAEVQTIVDEIGTDTIAVFREDDPDGIWCDPEAFGFKKRATVTPVATKPNPPVVIVKPMRAAWMTMR
jgi:hypothetical protein